MRTLTSLILLIVLFIPNLAKAGSGYEYQLYKNHENFGIVIFPKKLIYRELNDYITSISFANIASGKAVMRRGSKNENETLMMPLQVQKQHSIEKFIVIQILGRDEMMAGIYDPEWGLTLPSARYGMPALRENIPKTLNIFRGNNPQKKTENHYRAPSIIVNFSRKPDYNKMDFINKNNRLNGLEVKS
ncbi:MAG: hypothetical protein HOL15_09210 [Nitrospinaceae bacterium]|nr:hypothetical protein [Nitrospina sp.]MBT5376978.1 hypothetical protein [Nitrospinaceae bacterium]MBT5869912.1 hypothetical protein [Nitrospinaceae bacterium]